jgi:hypothetical protein
MNENRVSTKQSLRGAKGHRLTGWREQQSIREDKTIGRLLHRCTLLLYLVLVDNLWVSACLLFH